MTFTHTPIHDFLKDRSFLILAHRGFFGGNIPQNTWQSVQLAYLAGADLAEVDVARSQDGVFYLFHTKQEKRYLGLDKDFEECSSQEIDQCRLKNASDGYHDTRLERLEDFLEWLPTGYYINLDRAWDYFADSDFLDLIQHSGKLDQVFVKSQVEDSYLEKLAQTELLYMPIIHSQADFEKVASYAEIKVIGAELIIRSEDSDLLDAQWVKQMKDHGYLLLMNAEDLGEGFNLFLERTDTDALLLDQGASYQMMVDHGASIIQTDWPNFLYRYRETGKITL